MIAFIQTGMLSAASSGVTGHPVLAAMRPKAHDGSMGQRFEALFYPTPDDAYVLTFKYDVVANALSLSNPHPLGGSIHTQTIKEACLAAAELGEGDESSVHKAQFDRLLASSIMRDRLTMTPQVLGYNGDRSDDRLPLTRSQVRSIPYVGGS